MWVNMIKHMLSVEDKHELLRLNELFLSIRGIATTLVETLPDLQRQREVHQHQYNYNITDIHMHKYECYYDIGRQLYGSMHGVGMYYIHTCVHKVCMLIS